MFSHVLGRPANKRWEDEELLDIIWRFSLGETANSIAKPYCVTRNTIIGLINRVSKASAKSEGITTQEWKHKVKAEARYAPG